MRNRHRCIIMIRCKILIFIFKSSKQTWQVGIMSHICSPMTQKAQVLLTARENICYLEKQNILLVKLKIWKCWRKISTTAYAWLVQKPTFQNHQPIYKTKRRKSQAGWPPELLSQVDLYVRSQPGLIPTLRTGKEGYTEKLYLQK